MNEDREKKTSFVVTSVNDKLVVKTVFHKKLFVFPKSILTLLLMLGIFDYCFFALETQAQTDRSTNKNKVIRESISSGDEETTRENEEPISFSDEGRSGQQVAGESRGKCPQSAAYLTAIAPKSNLSRTATSRPRWWFYFPPSLRSQIKKIEFSLQDRDYRDLVRQEVSIPNNSSYLNVTLPKEFSGIELNTEYQWHLKIYCEPYEATVPAFVSGWVQRISPEPDASFDRDSYSVIALEYSQQGLWLDAVDVLLKNRLSEDESSNWVKSWQQIIYSPEISLELPLQKENSQ